MAELSLSWETEEHGEAATKHFLNASVKPHGAPRKTDCFMQFHRHKSLKHSCKQILSPVCFSVSLPGKLCNNALSHKFVPNAQNQICTDASSAAAIQRPSGVSLVFYYSEM